MVPSKEFYNKQTHKHDSLLFVFSLILEKLSGCLVSFIQKVFGLLFFFFFLFLVFVCSTFFSKRNEFLFLFCCSWLTIVFFLSFNFFDPMFFTMFFYEFFHFQFLFLFCFPFSSLELFAHFFVELPLMTLIETVSRTN